jgi:hypothetical protein
MPFAARRFLRENVPRERMMSRDLSGSCNFEALCGASMCFEFHFVASSLIKTSSGK